MVNLKQATALAKKFLEDNGVYLTTLKDVCLQDDKWVVSFEYSFLLTLPTVYVVELEKESGEVIGYHKKA
jgi:hypothetical protein